MKIKITNCSDSMFWYRDHINEIFLVHRIAPDAFWCREKNEYECLNFVLKKDCEVLDKEEN